MGTATGLSIGILLICISVAYSEVTVDSDASAAFKAVQSGKKSYAVFSLGGQLDTLELEKSSSGAFSSLVTDLENAKSESQPRYAFYSSNYKGQLRLVFFVWTPMSASVALKKAYKDEADDTVEALGADPWVVVNTGSATDLNLDMIYESAEAGYNVIESSEYYYQAKENIESKTTLTVDASAQKAFTKVSQGTNPYVVFDVSSDYTTVSLDKLGARGAGFDDLADDLAGSDTPKIGVIPIDVSLGSEVKKKWLMVDWIPSQVSDADRMKMRNLATHLKAELKTEFFFELPTSSRDDLDLEQIKTLALGGKVQTPSGHVDFTFSNGAKGALTDISNGKIRYATFKFSDDKRKIDVDLVAPLKSDFNGFIDDFINVQNDKECRYTIFLAQIKVKGKVVLKLISYLWVPYTAPEKLRSLYETNFPSFKVLSKAPILLDVSASSVGDLNLDATLKVALGKDYEGQGNLGGDVLGEANVNVPDVKFDLPGSNALKLLLKGQKRYAIFNLNNGKATLEKLADFSTSFDNLKVDLLNAEKRGEPKYAIFMAPVAVQGRTELKPMFITWAPLTASKQKRTLYLQSAPKFKLALGFKPWADFVCLTVNDLVLPGMVKTGLKNNLIELQLGNLGIGLGSDLLNPVGAIGGLLGTAGNLVGGVAGPILGLGKGLVGGVLGLGSGLLNAVGGVLGGILGGKGGLLGGILGGGSEGGGLLGGILGGGSSEGGGLLGGILGGGSSQTGGGGGGGGFLGGFLGPVGSVVEAGTNLVGGLVKAETAGLVPPNTQQQGGGGFLGGFLGGGSKQGGGGGGFLFG